MKLRLFQVCYVAVLLTMATVLVIFDAFTFGWLFRKLGFKHRP